MLGKIISFDEHTKQGVILTDEDARYTFNEFNWQGKHLPKIGDNVEFSLSSKNEVSHVTYYHHDHQPSPQAQSTNAHNTKTVSVNNQQSISDNDALYAKEANYNMIDWFMKCMRNYVAFKGRARRQEYWYFYLVNVILGIVAFFLDVLIEKVIGTDLEIVSNISSLILFLPTLAVGARRLHDIGKSGWWQLIGIIPIMIFVFITAWSPTMATVIIGGTIIVIAWISLIVLLATETTPETNRYGPPAKPM